MRGYRLFKDGQEHYTENLAAFCREHGLQRKHLAAVISGERQSHRGWSLPPDIRKPKPEQTAPASDGSMTVGQVLETAEIAARSSGDPAYERLVMSRIEKLRRGEPLPIRLTD